ncbi:uncharacterized protein LOC132621323 isoform X2 [Lycium barbarum]|uniref:uncharacterized protein LOC132621323 isoform X2 n=1 Tax=Lycium barbarum TaxID=112863 RepID=UPI00293E1EBF|nr:uncharacterized protein LOC132621323 isoform X2 [Lycium barbarum]
MVLLTNCIYFTGIVRFCNFRYYLYFRIANILKADRISLWTLYHCTVSCVFPHIKEKFQLAVSQSTVDESEISPNDAVGKVLGKEHSGRVRYLGLGATPSTHFKQTKPRVGGIRIPSNDVGCSSFGCQDKYNKLLNTFKAYMIMKEGSIPEQFAGIFGSPPTTPSDVGSS